MALRLEDKKALVKEVNAVAGDSVTAVAAEYRGLSVSQMTELRKEARDAGVYMRVVKNTLARRAVEGTALITLAPLTSPGYDWPLCRISRWSSRNGGCCTTPLPTSKSACGPVRSPDT